MQCTFAAVRTVFLLLFRGGGCDWVARDGMAEGTMNPSTYGSKIMFPQVPIPKFQPHPKAGLCR